MSEGRTEKGTCRTGVYRTNEPVKPSKMGKTLVCWGGMGQPRCKYFKTCARENGVNTIGLRNG